MKLQNPNPWRGGAGFPMGKNGVRVARIESDVKYVVCNGDEGDPGAFMDGSRYGR